MPRLMRTVVVFGDSLSDIGRKWVTKSGRAARLMNEMRVNDTGRFSDCRNWTDFMYEEAGGASLLGDDAGASYERSQLHMTIAQAAVVTPSGVTGRNWCYLNYAEGGACGDTPHEKAAFLGTCKDQVDEFEKQYKGVRGLSDFLFLIWFGANDLYTANRPENEMGLVAQQLATVQRNRLREMVRASDPNPKFIFVNLARPLTAVRYAQRLESAKANLVTALRSQSMAQLGNRPPTVPGAYRSLGSGALRMLRMGSLDVRNAVDQAMTGLVQKELQALTLQVRELQKLERGVMLFNLELARIARANGDRVAELGSVITEQSVEALVSGSHRMLTAGAATSAAGHISARSYDRMTQGQYMAHITTIDQVHPTDAMYRIIWQEIRNEIYLGDLTFGTLRGVTTPGTLSQLAGPTQAARTNFNAVMAELKQPRPPAV